jgi:hypothetical protein
MARTIKLSLGTMIGGLVFIVAVGLTVWLGHRAAVRDRELVKELQSQSEELNKLLQSNPAPTADNIRTLSHDREQLEQLYPEILRAASRAKLAPPALRRPVEFQELLARKIKQFRQTASEVGVDLPEGFALGFRRYAASLPCAGTTGADCERALADLAKQLLVTEKLCDMLFALKVDGIYAIRRMEVEPGTGEDTIERTLPKDSGSVYKVLPFEFRFGCSTDKLRAFLNELSQSDWFFVVRSMDIAAADASATGRLAVTLQIDLLEFPAESPKTGG